MRSEQIMKREIQCMQPGDKVQDAARLMRDQNVGFLPVCDAEKKVLGTLTDRDIAVRVVAEGKPPTCPVEQVMTREAVTCRPQDDIQKVQELMAQNHKSRILCVDEQRRLVGIISLSDIAQHERGPRASETLRQVSEREVRA